MGLFDLFRPEKWLPPVEDGKETAYSAAEDIAFERNEAPLTRDVILRFGGRGFLFNLRMWEAATRSGPACRVVPPDDHYRKRMETLAQTGVATRGQSVPLEMRLLALPMATLRQGAKELGAGGLRDRTSGAALLAKCAGAEAWVAGRLNVEDLFLLRPEPFADRDMETLWRTYEQEALDTLTRAEPEDGDGTRRA